jgi:protein ImuB
MLCIWFPNRSRPYSRDGRPAPETGRIAADDSAKNRTGLQRLAHWCRRYSPLVGLEESIAPDSLLLDVTGCAHLFGGEERMARQIAHDLHRGGWTCHIAIADTIGAAWAIARHRPRHADQQSAIIPTGKQADALRPLPVAALRISAGNAEVLNDLGIETISQLMTLSRKTLPSRFGPEILRRLDQALGHIPEFVVPERPQEPLVAQWGCEAPIEDRLTLETVLQQLLSRLIRRLQSRNEGILQFLVELHVPHQEAAQFSVGLMQPTLRDKRLLELLRLQLERVSLAGGVDQLTVRVTRTAPLDVEQAELFETSECRTGRRDLDLLFDRLSNRLGHEAVLRSKLHPDFDPERAVEYSTLVGKDHVERKLTAEHPLDRGACSRPLRLFRRPFPVVVWSIVPNGPPIRLRGPHGDQEIVYCDGPERIETGWWREGPLRRDYFRVDTERGQRLWLFQSRDEGSWFVHGTF